MQPEARRTHALGNGAHECAQDVLKAVCDKARAAPGGHEDETVDAVGEELDATPADLCDNACGVPKALEEHAHAAPHGVEEVVVDASQRVAQACDYGVARGREHVAVNPHARALDADGDIVELAQPS